MLWHSMWQELLKRNPKKNLQEQWLIWSVLLRRSPQGKPMFTINLKELRHVKRLEKFSLIFFNFIVGNPCQSSLTPSLFPYGLLFSYLLLKVLFSVFLQFKCNFVDGQNNSKYCDVAPSLHNHLGFRIIIWFS